MAYTGIFCTEAEITSREGAGVSSSVTEAMHNSSAAMAESFINVTTRYNWSDAYSGLNADVKAVLSETAACLAAINGIEYDMSGYTSRGEAESMITTLRDIALRNISILRDIKAQTFMQGA